MTSTYPFDHTGVLPANAVKNELKSPTAGNGINAYLMRPKNAPFYKAGFLVVSKATGQSLVEGEHFFFVYPWQQGRDHTGKEVFGAIATIGDVTLDDVYLNYQTLGGTYVDDSNSVIQDGLVALSSILEVDWDTAPTTFPSLPHNHLLSGATGMSDILLRLDQFVAAVNAPQRSIVMDNITDLDVEFIEPLLTALNNLALAINTSGTIGNELTTLTTRLTELEDRVGLVEPKVLHASPSRDGIMSKELFDIVNGLA